MRTKSKLQLEINVSSKEGATFIRGEPKSIED